MLGPVRSLWDSLARMARGWNRFWFSPGDPTVLGFMRICCGLTILYVHFAFSYDLQAFFGPHAWLDEQTMNKLLTEAPVIPPASGWQPETIALPPQNQEEARYINEWGVNPRQLAGKGQFRWSFWYYLSDPTAMWIAHGAVLFVMFLFTIGFCTRITSVLTWLAMLSYIHRAPTSLFGMDTITIVVVFYLMIGPSGAALSVDRLIRRYWSSYRALRAGLPAPDFLKPEKLVSARFALRLLQVHACVIYAASGLSKLQGGMWWSGTATWGTMANYEFAPMRFQMYMDMLNFLAAHRWLWEIVMTGGTYFTLAFEISFAFLVWNRNLRWTMIACAVALHLGIAICMGLVTFSIMMLILVSSFVPARTIREFVWRLGRGAEGVRLLQLERA